MLTPGISYSWNLPQIKEGGYPLAKILFVPNDDITELLMFDEGALRVTYNGEAIDRTENEGTRGGLGVSSLIRIELVDSQNNKSAYT